MVKIVTCGTLKLTCGFETAHNVNYALIVALQTNGTGDDLFIHLFI